MIQRKDAPPPPPLLPWAPAEALAGLTLAALWTTGPDPERDGLFRVQGLRPGPAEDDEADATGRVLDRFAQPFGSNRTGGVPADEGESERPAERQSATARMRREFGVRPADLEGAGDPALVLEELLDFAAGGPLVVPDRAGFEAWARALAPGRRLGPVLGLEELAGLLFPGRLSSDRATLCARLVRSHPDLPRAVGPRELQSALGELVGRFLTQAEPVLGVAVHGWARAATALVGPEPEALRELAFALSLVEHPSLWSRAPGELFDDHAGLADGRLSAAFGAWEGLFDALGDAEPLWKRPEPPREAPTVPPHNEDLQPFAAEDLVRLDEIFQVHLPEHFGGKDAYREGQHETAREVAASLGRGELFLVHAPTGTGKTLAYLLPAMIWSRRNDVRVGLCTYTRALQEQAMDREVPLALALLARAGWSDLPRVALLKGRRNYLCWRSMSQQRPAREESGLEQLVWTQLALFALTDPDGDLDRLPRGPALEALAGLGGKPRSWERELGRLLRLVRSEVGCCRSVRDRETCAGDAARRRAERSHVVITNHAFALARQEFFRHVVFDECEHLHDVAHDAWSHELQLSDLRRRLERVHHTRRPGALEAVRRAAGYDSLARDAAEIAVESVRQALDALDSLEGTLFHFKRWRADVERERQPNDAHSLFREYALSPDGVALLDAHMELVRGGEQAQASLAQIAEHLDDLALSSKSRVRRTLERTRGELGDALTAVDAWIPRNDEGPGFSPGTYYDLETDPRGEDALAARVLLPHEALGTHYYPELQSGIFLSATCWLKGGFEAASKFLGLERASNPTEEWREPCEVRTFRAPEVFDYERVLFAVPRDAPAYRLGKGVYLEYVARFVAHLSERTRGRMLVLFTSADDCRRVGQRLTPFFAARHLPLWYQGMPGAEKEELGELFRSRTDSVLLGLDTFWYGADFPGETLEYLVIVKLPYGVPDGYHHAQCASMGPGDQRSAIYMPRALAKFRQGFGRLMRKVTDRGCVFVLDTRVLEPRHRAFLRELPLAEPALFPGQEEPRGARFVRGDTDHCLREALAHMGMLEDVKLRGLDAAFARTSLGAGAGRPQPYHGPGSVSGRPASRPLGDAAPRPVPRRRSSNTGAEPDVDLGDVPF